MSPVLKRPHYASRPNRRLVHRNVPTSPHPFEPSGRLVGRTRAEACDWCGLVQRGSGSMHPGLSHCGAMYDHAPHVHARAGDTFCCLGGDGIGPIGNDLPTVDVPCPHDPTGTSPYACACEDG